MNKKEFIDFDTKLTKDLNEIIKQSSLKSMYCVNVVSKEAVAIKQSLNRIASEMDWTKLPF